jgi:hypothetical protein
MDVLVHVDVVGPDLLVGLEPRSPQLFGVHQR